MNARKNIELPDEVAEQILQNVLLACQIQPSSFEEAKKRLESNRKRHVHAQRKCVRAKKNTKRTLKCRFKSIVNTSNCGDI